MSARAPVVLRRPEQGWSSLALLLGLLVLLGVSIADARPLVGLPGAARLSGSLPGLMLAAGLCGYLLARSRVGVVRAHIIGAGVAALLLLLVAGEVLLVAGGAEAPASAISERVGAVWMRLSADMSVYLSDQAPTPGITTYLLLGAICWTTAQFAAFAIFRYDRGGPAVLAIGAVLFLNLALDSLGTTADHLPVLLVLALFALLSMLLLVRLQLLAQQTQWARRHIADTQQVGRLFLRGGFVFVVFAVASASTLTAVATVERQRIDLGDIEEPLQDLGDELARALGLLGVPPPDPNAGTRARFTPIRDSWDPGDGTAFSAVVEGRLRGNYWWGYADHEYDPDRGGWRRADGSEVPRPAGADLRVSGAGLAGGPHTADVTVTIGEAATGVRQAFRLADVEVYPQREVVVTSVDDGGSVSDVLYDEPPAAGEKIRFSASVRDYRDDGTSLTADDLRAAGEEYPAWIGPYRAGVEDERVGGPSVDAFVAEIEATAPTPYDKAIAVQSALAAMDYVLDLGGACGAAKYGGSIPECVLAEQKGFCQHYATTMALVLRQMDVPTRFVTGYLPGVRDAETGVWTVEQQALHNWVEVYFPGHGWVRFDPTPGLERFGQSLTGFPDEEFPEPGASPDPRERSEPFDEETTPEPTPDVTPFVDSAGVDDSGAGYLLVGGGVILALVVTVISLLLLSRLRRLPGGDEGLAYRGIVSLATRLGYGPHPSQTEYEYAGTLSEAIPTVRDELYVVADARVETAYGGRQLDPSRRGRLRQAYARIRTALLRLSVRRRR